MSANFVNGKLCNEWVDAELSDDDEFEYSAVFNNTRKAAKQKIKKAYKNRTNTEEEVKEKVAKYDAQIDALLKSIKSLVNNDLVEQLDAQFKEILRIARKRKLMKTVKGKKSKEQKAAARKAAV